MADGFKLTEVLALRMRLLQQRQGVIAQNIANADTPGYRARDISEPDFKALVASGDSRIARPRVTASGTMRQLGATAGAETVAAGSDEMKPNGNDVSLEAQVLTMGEIQADYQMAAGLYRKSMGLLRLALGK